MYGYECASPASKTPPGPLTACFSDRLAKTGDPGLAPVDAGGSEEHLSTFSGRLAMRRAALAGLQAL